MAIDAETQRLMLNWVRWLTSAPAGMAAASTYELAAARGWAQDVPLPLINSDAEEVERAIKQLDEARQRVIVEYWLFSDTVPKKAKRCRCSERTFWRMLHRAHQTIQTFRQRQREREQKARAAYAQGQLPVAF